MIVCVRRVILGGGLVILKQQGRKHGMAPLKPSFGIIPIVNIKLL
jgi:hypothetical protein